MSTRPLDPTPTTHLIAAQRERNISVNECMEELVDNSLDAGARHVEILLASGVLSIVDDGHGCADVERMLRMGSHAAHPTTTSGRFGVGMKDAVIPLAAELRIDTETTERRETVQVDWAELERSGEWRGKVFATDMERKGVPGTRLRLHGLYKKIRMPDLVTHLGFIFAPAIRAGRVIACGRDVAEPVKPFTAPRLSASEMFEFAIRGLDVRCQAGLVADGERNEKPGFLLFNHSRVITRTSEPAGEYSTSRFFAHVELVGRWPLTRNKDGLSDEAIEEELYEELGSRAEPLLREAASQSRRIEVSQLLADANALLGNLAGGRRPGEGGSRSGPSGQKKAGGGTGRRPRRPSGLLVDFGQLAADTFSDVEVKARRVVFNQDNLAVESLMREGGLALARTAVHEYVAAAALAPGQGDLPFDGNPREQYQRAMAKWMAEIDRRHRGNGVGAVTPASASEPAR